MTKKIEIKLGRLGNPAFAAAFNRLAKLRPMPVLDSFALAKTLRAFEAEQSVYTQACVKLIQDHGGTETAPGNWAIDPKAEKFAAYVEERAKLEALPLKTELTRKIQLTGMADLSAQDLMELEDLVEAT
jgi:hypothetical protein